MELLKALNDQLREAREHLELAMEMKEERGYLLYREGVVNGLEQAIQEIKRSK